jgi:hypothetical protein
MTSAGLDELAVQLDPSLLMEDLGLDPDPWQRTVLRSTTKRLLMLTSRQAGKSTTAAILGLHTALYQPGALVILVSPSQRQSGLLFRKLTRYWGQLGRPVAATEENATSLGLANGSWVVGLPGNPETIRGFSAPSMIILDEAALVDDAMFAAITPMLAVGVGRLVCLSTPMGRRGGFFELWSDGGTDWERIKVSAPECPRISAEFLDEQRRTLGPRWFGQEFLCEFADTIDQVFSAEAVLAAFDSHEEPLFAST